MIPLRVSLKNFLCYREQVFEFGNHPVWLLHGPNGVGKSAIFDGMVYALFGEHKRSAASRNSGEDLIRRGESSLRVEFDFEFGDRRYQVWRTRSKSGSISQGVYKVEDGAKVAVRDVKNARDLDAWVIATLGLNYDTFVSAVLLRQGAAEKLIDSKKETRRELFRGIIDLDPYIELYDKVNKAKGELVGTVRTQQTDLEKKVDVSEEQIAAATEERTASEVAWEEALSSQKLVAEMLGDAQRWEGYQKERKDLSAKLEQANQRASMADDLKAGFARLVSLREGVPALILTRTRRAELEVAGYQQKQLIEGQSKAEERRSALSVSADKEGKRAANAQARITEIQRLIVGANAGCERLRAEIERSSQAEALHRRLAEKKQKLAAFAPDIDERLADAIKDLIEAQSANDSLSYFEAIVRDREDFQRATRDFDKFTLETETAAALMAKLILAVAEAHRVAEETEGQRTEAQQSQAVADGRLADSTRWRDEFSTLANDALCSACRQPITEEHAAHEMLKREQAITSAASEAERCRNQVATLIESAKAAREDHANKLNELKRAEIEKSAAGQSRSQAEKQAEAARRSFERAKAGLADEIGLRVLDVSADGFPTMADIEFCRRLKQALKERECRKNEYIKSRDDRESTIKEIATLTDAVIAIGSPCEVSLAREELSAIERTLSDLGEEERTLTGEKTSALSAEGGHRQELDSIALEINRLIASLGGAEVSVKNARANLAAAIQAVPTEYKTMLDDLDGPVDAFCRELQDLESANVESEWLALASDRTLLANWQNQLREVELQIEELPVEARRPVVELKPLETSAEDLVKARDTQRLGAISKLESLKRQHVDRCDAVARLAEAQKKLTLHKALAELLGDKGIQIDLVRDAEQRIVQLANDILIRVSSGDLSIEPPDPEAEQSFELFVRRAGCPESISASNLSGGQRFRLAVSLALAVCKFASGEKIPLESVIIDEGFGSLDREGRMAMISELRDGHELNRMFKRVLIVSHQDDFASAFPVGYLLSSQDGITTVESFDRR